MNQIPVTPITSQSFLKRVSGRFLNVWRPSKVKSSGPSRNVEEAPIAVLAVLSLKSRKELATNSQFLLKVEMSMLKICTYVACEAVSGKVAVDQKRHDLTQNIVADRKTWIERFAHVAASRDQLTTASTDGDVETEISGIWNYMAGVSGADLAA